MSELNVEQIQSIQDFKKAVEELLEDLHDSCLDLESIDGCMEDVWNSWQNMKNQFEDEDTTDPELDLD